MNRKERLALVESVPEFKVVFDELSEDEQKIVLDVINHVWNTDKVFLKEDAKTNGSLQAYLYRYVGGVWSSPNLLAKEFTAFAKAEHLLKESEETELIACG